MCLTLQLLLENQNRLHIIFDEKISILHAHVNVPEKKSEVKGVLKRSLRSKSSTLGKCKNEVLIRTALLRSQNLFDTQFCEASSKRRLRPPFRTKISNAHRMLCPLKAEETFNSHITLFLLVFLWRNERCEQSEGQMQMSCF